MNTENTSSQETAENLSILIAAIHEELAETYLQSVCTGAVGLEGDTVVENHPVRLEAVAEDSRSISDLEQKTKDAQAAALVVRFLDVISIDKIKHLYHVLTTSVASLPLAVMLFREEGELDFKISCPACGQKLWVRDVDYGKGGRCPNCKKGFKLPSQSGHIREQLDLPESTPVMTVVRGNTSSCRGSLGALVASACNVAASVEEHYQRDTLRQQTVDVQLEDNGNAE